MKHWHVARDADGYVGYLVEVPWWAVAATVATDAVDGHLGHWMCGQGMPEWVSRVPLGRPRYDAIGDERWLTNSLTSHLADAFNWLVGLDTRHERVRVSVRLTIAEAARLGAIDIDD